MSDIFKNSSKKQAPALAKEQVAVLLNFCYCNARDLFEEAEILRRHQKYARAFYLCAVSLEELAKIPIALNALFIPEDDKRAWQGFWNTFNSHLLKQKAVKQYGQTILKEITKDRWDKFYRNQIPEGLPLNEMKMASLYVDCFGGVAARPNEMFKGEESVISIFRVTTDRLSAFEELHSTFDGSIRFVEATMKSSIKVGSQHMKDLIVDYFRGRG
jgi:AbiV family abortive infection protein